MIAVFCDELSSLLVLVLRCINNQNKRTISPERQSNAKRGQTTHSSQGLPCFNLYACHLICRQTKPTFELISALRSPVMCFTSSTLFHCHAGTAAHEDKKVFSDLRDPLLWSHTFMRPNSGARSPCTLRSCPPRCSQKPRPWYAQHLQDPHWATL